MKHLRFMEAVYWAPEGAEGGAEAEAEVEVPVAEVEASAEAEAEAQVAPTPRMVPAHVVQQRVAAMTRRQKDLERELELLKLEKTLDPAATPTPQALPETEVNRRAAALASQMEINRRADAVAKAGVKVSPDFLVKIGEMQQIHGQLSMDFLEVVMEAGDSDEDVAKVLLGLANDPERAAEIFGMNPRRQAVALAKYGAEVQKKTPKPRATPAAPPPPITPRVGAGASPKPKNTDLYSPEMPLDDWMRQRNEQAKAKRRY